MKGKARNVRKNQTDAEELLWYHLRNRRLASCKFRRQHPVGPYVVDFVCIEKQLIIEIDGGQHALAIQKDSRRSAYLESKGFRVVRFWNNQVLNEIQEVLEVILKTLGVSTPSPRPSPPKTGARGSVRRPY